MIYQIPESILSRKDLSTGDKVVLSVCIAHGEITHSRICSVAGLSKNSVQRAITRLKSTGVMKVVSSVGVTNKYSLASGSPERDGQKDATPKQGIPKKGKKKKKKASVLQAPTSEEIEQREEYESRRDKPKKKKQLSEGEEY